MRLIEGQSARYMALLNDLDFLSLEYETATTVEIIMAMKLTDLDVRRIGGFNPELKMEKRDKREFALRASKIPHLGLVRIMMKRLKERRR